MTRTRKGTVYALIDPRDHKIRYVGKTEKPMLSRLASHLATPTNPAMRVWITTLSLKGLTPRIVAVATVPVDRLAAEEKRQIELHAAEGHRLFNAPYYHQNLGDLGQDPAKPIAPGRPPLPGASLAPAAFGSLAAARARGQVPAWAAGALVLAGAPLYLAVVILRTIGRTMLNTQPGLAITGLTAGCWILWDAGFDRAACDLIAPHLPAVDWASAWDAYLAGPLATLGSGFLWPYVAVSVLVAGMSYAEIAEAAGVKPRR